MTITKSNGAKTTSRKSEKSSFINTMSFLPILLLTLKNIHNILSKNFRSRENYIQIENLIRMKSQKSI